MVQVATPELSVWVSQPEIAAAGEGHGAAIGWGRVTVAVKVTLWPTVEGFGEEVSVVVVVVLCGSRHRESEHHEQSRRRGRPEAPRDGHQSAFAVSIHDCPRPLMIDPDLGGQSARSAKRLIRNFIGTNEASTTDQSPFT